MVQQSVILTPPIPPYQNVPIQPLYYLPSRFVITALSFGQTTTVTTSVNHNYVIGQLCRLSIPQSYGSFQINGSLSYVVGIPNPNQVVLALVSNGTSAFIPSPVFATFQSQTLPEILAIGDSASGAINANGNMTTNTFIPGSFINISPEITT